MPMRKVIVNSTPIIALADIGRLDILQDVYGEIIIPDAVYDEVTVKDSGYLDGYDWIKVGSITNQAAKKFFISALHDGEVEVMILATEIEADLVIIDDGLARKHAKRLGLTVTGTLGVLLRAKSNGNIEAVKPLLDNLIQDGLYISKDVYDEVLSIAGEL